MEKLWEAIIESCVMNEEFPFKGQLISKANFKIFIWTNKPTKMFQKTLKNLEKFRICFWDWLTFSNINFLSDQLWKKLEGNKIENKAKKAKKLTLSDVQIPEDGDTGRITGSWTIEKQDGNTGTETTVDPSIKKLEYKRRSVDEEWFTLEPVNETEHYLTWKLTEFVFESKYY